MVPLKVFEKKRLIKLEIGLARARQKQDKREVIKKRGSTQDRESSSTIKKIDSNQKDR